MIVITQLPNQLPSRYHHFRAKRQATCPNTPKLTTFNKKRPRIKLPKATPPPSSRNPKKKFAARQTLACGWLLSFRKAVKFTLLPACTPRKLGKNAGDVEISKKKMPKKKKLGSTQDASHLLVTSINLRFFVSDFYIFRIGDLDLNLHLALLLGGG